MDIKQELLRDIFYDYDLDEVDDRNAVDYHTMSGEHTEILGQFLDKTALNVEQLKECLVLGYLKRITGK